MALCQRLGTSERFFRLRILYFFSSASGDREFLSEPAGGRHRLSARSHWPVGLPNAVKRRT